MSTFLQLASALRRETTDSGSGPTTVTGQSGELARMVAWIADAYTELQIEREDYLWLRGAFTVNTVAGTDSYAYTDCTDTTSGVAIARFARWYQGFDVNGFPYFTSYLTSAGVGGEFPLIWTEWDAFRRLYKVGTQNNGQPCRVSMSPDMKFVLGPKPDAIYTVNGVYQKGPQILAADDDIPEMPTRFHNLIVYEAMSKYGGTRVAPEAMLRAASEGGRLRAMLEIDQLPKMGYGSPLA